MREREYLSSYHDVWNVVGEGIAEIEVQQCIPVHGLMTVVVDEQVHVFMRHI